MTVTRPQKSHYTETEAAEALGVTVDHLRIMVRNHLIQADEDMKNLTIAGFQPPDLLVLKLLSGHGMSPISRH